MEEQTTTTPAVTQDSGAVDTAQPAEQPAEAVSDTPSEPLSTDQSDDITPAADTSDDSAAAEEPQSSNTDDITAWLSKKGIDPTSPEALAKVAEMARNSEKLMTKSRQEVAQAKKELEGAFQNTDTTDVAGQVQELKLKDMARDFVDRHPDARDDISGMVGYLQTNADIQTLTEAGVLSLEQVHAMYLNSPAQADKLKQQGGQEALTKLANKQRAAAVSGSASSPSPQKPKADDAFLKGFNNPF